MQSQPENLEDIDTGRGSRRIKHTQGNSYFAKNLTFFYFIEVKQKKKKYLFLVKGDYSLPICEAVQC